MEQEYEVYTKLEFSVNTTYGLLRGEIEGESSPMFKFFWRIKALPSAVL